MRDANFIPSYRLAARRRRRRLTYWVAAVAAYAVLLVAGIGAGHVLWGGSRAMLAQEREKTTRRIQAAGLAIRAVQADLAKQGHSLKAEQVALGQPDWSLLLTLLARSLNEGMVLGQCELKPDVPAVKSVAGASAPATQEPPAAFALSMAGYGQNMGAVLQFAQELERTTLFDQIRLTKTDAEPFLAGTAIRFQMECSLGRKAEVPK